MPESVMENMKKSKVIDMYYKIIMIMIDDWKNECRESKKAELKAELMEFIDMFENAI